MSQRKPKDRILTPWTFDEDVASGFYTHARQSIPFYEEVHRMVEEISILFLRKDATICDVGTATGEAIVRLMQSHKSVIYYGIDNSPAMLKTARDRIGDHTNIRLVHSDAKDFVFPPSDLILLLYTLSFIEQSERSPLLGRIYSCIKPGGGLILVDKVTIPDPQLKDAFMTYHEAMKRRSGFTQEQIDLKKARLEGVLVPFTLSENIRILQVAGFAAIETFFRWYNFAGIVARKNV